MHKFRLAPLVQRRRATVTHTVSRNAPHLGVFTSGAEVIHLCVGRKQESLVPNRYCDQPANFSLCERYGKEHDLEVISIYESIEIYYFHYQEALSEALQCIHPSLFPLSDLQIPREVDHKMTPLPISSTFPDI